MNVALYARASSDAQDVELSIAAQIKAIEDFAERNGHTIVKRFVDEALSGRSDARPAFQDLIEFARSPFHAVDAVLVWKFNRFSRDRLDSVTYKHLLSKANVEVISINEPVDNSPSGKMLEAMIEAYDEFFSANLGQDISRGMRQSAANGNFVASVAPYGYRKKEVSTGERSHWTLEPDEEEAEIVRRMFALADSGSGLKAIASELNTSGVRTRRDKLWSNSGVRKILGNEAYTGTLVWGRKQSSAHNRSEADDPLRIEQAWEALVSKRQFNRVQSVFKSRRPHRLHPRMASSEFILTGFSRCGGCGSALTGHVAKSGAYRYYQCSGRNKRGRTTCDQSMVRRELFESAVLSRIAEVLLAPGNIERIAREVNRELRSRRSSSANRIRRIEREIDDDRMKLQRYYDSFESGMLEPGDFKDRVAALKSRIAELEVSKSGGIDSVTGRSIDITGASRYVARIQETLKSANAQDRKEVLRSFVEQIALNNDEVTVEYHLPTGQPSATDGVLSTMNSGGAGGIRTPYLFDANEALSQMSYSPD